MSRKHVNFKSVPGTVSSCTGYGFALYRVQATSIDIFTDFVLSYILFMWWRDNHRYVWLF